MHRIATRKELRNVLVFSGCYLAVAGIVIILGGNHEFLLYLVVMMMIILAVIGVYKRAGISRGVLWGFSIWGVLHLIGGLTPIPAHWHDSDTTGVVYNWRVVPGYLKYDQMVHGFGVGLVTWLCWQALAVRVRSFDGSALKPTLGMLAICAAAGMGFGALNEVIEFFAVMLLPKTNVGDYVNTGWDLVANLAGASVTGMVIRLVWRINHPRQKILPVPEN
ncbi:MAG: DUF2238 domain-containing protein [Verrucomicrobiales bacterium]|nr:DUF2238 domain-containing protein [Verrucomicrobiales bacterium]